jgi:hypothetical protein
MGTAVVKVLGVVLVVVVGVVVVDVVVEGVVVVEISTFKFPVKFNGSVSER